MKKLLSFFMAFVIIILSLATPALLSFAEEGDESEQALYTVDGTVYADAYMLINLDDEDFPVVAQKNQDKRKFPASLTKMVTAIVTINNVSDLSEKTKVSKAAIMALANTGASVAGLKPGDEVTVEQLLYLTMVQSACDACQVLAEYVAGSVDEFVKMMNIWVKSIGCENTNFVNPDGLHDENHYSTASDMSKIAIKAMEDSTFEKIATTPRYEYNGRTFVHTNFMMDKFHVSYYYEYASGIKTGSTSQAGYCLVTQASKDGYNYLAVIMDSPMKRLKGYDTKCSFIDARTLFEWAFKSLKYSTVVNADDVIAEITVNNGKDADTVQLVAQEDITTLVPVSLDPSAVIVQPVELPEEIDAPVKKGSEICEANIIYADTVIAKTTLVASKDVELSTFLKIMNSLKKFFGNKIVLAILILLILGVFAYIVIFGMKLQKDKKRIAEKRRRQQELDDRLNGYYDDNYLEPPKHRK